MKVETRTVGQVTILKLEGRFDSYEAPNVSELLEKAAVLSPHILVNLEEVGFVDSTALAILIKGVKRCRENQGDLYICGLQDAVKRIIELTRLDKAFKIFPNEITALQAFGQGQM